MKPLTSLQIKHCQVQARIFEKSIKRVNYGSCFFIERFMNSSVAKMFDEELFMFSTIADEDVFDILDEEFGNTKNKYKKYSKDEMFWIGYIYRCISFRYHLSSKEVLKLFSPKEIVKYYYIGHTFDIVGCAERMMEKIGYEKSSNIKNCEDEAENEIKFDPLVEEKAYELMKKLIYEERLSNFKLKN